MLLEFRYLLLWERGKGTRVNRLIHGTEIYSNVCGVWRAYHKHDGLRWAGTTVMGVKMIECFFSKKLTENFRIEITVTASLLKAAHFCDWTIRNFEMLQKETSFHHIHLFSFTYKATSKISIEEAFCLCQLNVRLEVKTTEKLTVLKSLVQSAHFSISLFFDHDPLLGNNYRIRYHSLGKEKNIQKIRSRDPEPSKQNLSRDLQPT